MERFKLRLFLLKLFIVLAWLNTNAQQFPIWTQHRSNLFLVNPAVAGTRKTIDARASYRQQWIGFTGAPSTATLSLHSRFFKGKMGAGGYIYTDKLGPSSFTAFSLSYAYHLKFDDTELSFGANASYNTQVLDGSKLTYHNTQDLTVQNAVLYNKSSVPNAAFGLLFYNDRFYIGAAANNLLGTAYKFPENNDKKKAEMKTRPHYSLNIGYNYSGDSHFIFENSVFTNFVIGTPILVDYNLRVHYKNAVFAGLGIRLKNALIAQVGFTFEQSFQIAYSVDIGINKFTSANYGTHEIKLVYVFDKDKHKKHGNSDQFSKQRYQNML